MRADETSISENFQDNLNIGSFSENGDLCRQNARAELARVDVNQNYKVLMLRKWEAVKATVRERTSGVFISTVSSRHHPPL